MRRSSWRAGSARRCGGRPKLVREAVGADSPIEAGGGRSRPARVELRGKRGLASSKVCRPPGSRRRCRFMSTGSVAIPQLKAAASANQIAERLTGGPWAGLEVALRPADVSTPAAVERAVTTTLAATDGRSLALTAEAPVAWPSGAFVNVGRLTDEAQECVGRCVDFAAGIGSPVLTLHLYAPLAPDEFRARRELDEDGLHRFLRFYADACLAQGVAPLVENVPPVLRMRIDGMFLSEIGGHWRDLRARGSWYPSSASRWTRRTRGSSAASPPPTRALRAQLRRGARARPLRGRARRPYGRRPHLRCPRPARRRTRMEPASSTSTGPWLGRRPRPLSRGGDRRARSGPLARHEAGIPRDRASGAAAPARPGPGPSGSDRTTSTGRRCSAAETRFPRCRSSRSSTAGAASSSPVAPDRWEQL